MLEKNGAKRTHFIRKGEQQDRPGFAFAQNTKQNIKVKRKSTTSIISPYIRKYKKKKIFMRKLSCSGKLSNYVMCCVHWRNINVPLVYTFSFRVNVIAKKKISKYVATVIQIIHLLHSKENIA